MSVTSRRDSDHAEQQLAEQFTPAIARVLAEGITPTKELTTVSAGRRA